MQGKATKSIADSLTRIIKLNYKDVSEDQIVVARVVTVYSDILNPDLFGTMDCYDEKNQIDIFDVPLNAHINDDGTSGFSGTYQFPKVGSAVYLALDVKVNRETFVPILFSHIDKVHTMYNEETITEVIEVTTDDVDKPYETEETGKKSKSSMTFDEIKTEVLVDDEGTAISQTVDTILLDGNNDDLQPLVMANTLMDELLSLIDEIGKITIQTPAGLSSPISSSPAWTLLVTKFQTDFEAFKSPNINLS
jgi:hypothetical protein